MNTEPAFEISRFVYFFTADGDYFYLINMPIEGVDDSSKSMRNLDLETIKKVKAALSKNGECIFHRLGFKDESFPNDETYDLGISQIIANEQQPLIAISSVKDKNKLIIFDNRLFVSCYQAREKDKKLQISFSLKFVIVTVLCQRAFLEYTSKMLLNISDNKEIKSFKAIQKEFGNFINSFWRLDISNSFYLNKSYRIIGKLWLLNEKHELVRLHLERNYDIENQRNQEKISHLLIIIGIITVIGILEGVYNLLSGFIIPKYSCLATIAMFLSFIIFSCWIIKRK